MAGSNEGLRACETCSGTGWIEFDGYGNVHHRKCPDCKAVALADALRELDTALAWLRNGGRSAEAGCFLVKYEGVIRAAINPAALAPAQEPAGGGEDWEPLETHQAIARAIGDRRVVEVRAPMGPVGWRGLLTVEVHDTFDMLLRGYQFRAAVSRLATPTPQAAGVSDAMVAGLTSKQAWWAGARAGLGLPADTPRADVAAALAAARTAAGAAPEGSANEQSQD